MRIKCLCIVVVLWATAAYCWAGLGMTEKEAADYYGRNRLPNPTTSDYRRVGFPTNTVISEHIMSNRVAVGVAYLPDDQGVSRCVGLKYTFLGETAPPPGRVFQLRDLSSAGCTWRKDVGRSSPRRDHYWRSDMKAHMRVYHQSPHMMFIAKQLDDIIRPVFEAKVRASADRVRAALEEHEKTGELPSPVQPKEEQ